MQDYSRSLLNQLLPSKKNLFDVLEHAPNFLLKLPSVSSRAVTVEYLLGVANQKYFAIKKSDYNQFVRKLPFEKFDYFVELKKFVQNLGFDENNLPDKKWLKNVLFSVKPKHHFFELPPLAQLQISSQ